MTNNMTYNIINRTIDFNGMVDVWIDSVPNGLHCSGILILIVDPWSSTCTKPLLIYRNKLLLPVIVLQCAFREIVIGVLCWAFTAFSLGVGCMSASPLGMWDVRQVRVFNFDSHLGVVQNNCKHVVATSTDTHTMLARDPHFPRTDCISLKPSFSLSRPPCVGKQAASVSECSPLEVVRVEDVRAVVDDTLVAREWGAETVDQSLVPGPNVREQPLVIHGFATLVVHSFTLSSPEGLSDLLTMS